MAIDLSSGESGQSADDSSDSNGGIPPVPTFVNGNRFLVERLIGSGSFGTVHRASDTLTNCKVAVKFEWQHEAQRKPVLKSFGRLAAEARIYETVVCSRYVPRVRWHGQQDGYSIMVMDLLGPSLQNLLSSVRCRGKFSPKTVLMLGVQMIDCIDFVHACGVLHRDIKPHNFCMGLGSRSSQVLILDFGLAKAYKDAETGNHVPYGSRKHLTGTERYASLNVHEFVEPSRRDDVESIGYVLMHCLRGDLPWLKLKKASKAEKLKCIRQHKQDMVPEGLCKGYPRQLEKYFVHCRSLQYFDRPDYELLRSLLKDILAQEQLRHDLRFDWTPRGGDGPLQQPNGDNGPLGNTEE